ncbi:MAG: hypothetical protein ACFCGT_10100 [Sandaracinaceae bacterium]
MRHFVRGFLLASVLWGGAFAYLYVVEGFRPPPAGSGLVVAASVDPAVEVAASDRPRRRRRRRGRRPRTERTPQGQATTGDDLREDEMRSLDLAGGGGTEQLPRAHLETTFDGAMPRIRRCLVLMAGEDPVTGRVVFGVRIAPTGAVEGVQLSGPAAATTGEAGDCLRSAVRTLRFPPFDGPAMVARFPLTLT